MFERWELNKRLDIGNYVVEFRTLYEDKRDAMCDAWRPQMGIADCENNRQVSVLRGSCLVPLWSKVCNRDEGNDLFREFRALEKGGGYGGYKMGNWLKEKGIKVK